MNQLYLGTTEDEAGRYWRAGYKINRNALRLYFLNDDNGPHGNKIVELLDILIFHTNTALGCRLADQFRKNRSMDPELGLIESQPAGS